MSDRPSEAAIRAILAELFGAERVLSAPEGPFRDLPQHDLGRPVAIVRPRSTAEVVRLVEAARRHRFPVVPVGLRTAYWRPLALAGAVAVETADLGDIGVPDAERGFVRVGAGASVGAVEDRLRASGLMLAAFPDAFGDTSVGSMVAGAFASGVGMGLATASELVAGLTVVLGTGEVLQTGAAAVLGAGAFTRLGLPDPTELFFASDGALGIVTEVAIRTHPRAAQAQLSAELPAGADGMRAALALASGLRVVGSYDTFRTSSVYDGPGRRFLPTRVDLAFRAPFGAEELAVRIGALRRRLAEAGATNVREQRAGPEGDVQLRAGEPGLPRDHRVAFVEESFVGADVVTSYADAAGCIDEALACVSRESALAGLSRIRTALYFSPAYVNLGLHFGFRPASPDMHPAAERAIAALGRHDVVPYRWGRLWEPVLGARLDRTYRGFLDDLRRRCDPDGILHPGATVFGAA